MGGKLHNIINIGPNKGPLEPPKDNPSVGVLAIEAYLGMANYLRETFHKAKYPRRFFVLNCAVAGAPLTGGLSTFHYYNSNGKSSSLSQGSHGPTSE